MTVTVRPARAEDEERLYVIDRATWSSLSSPSPVPPPERRFFREPGDVDVHVVAELDGVVVGYVKVEDASPLESHAHVAHVNGVAVDPAYGGRGVGRALMQAVVEEMRRRGKRKVSLRVLAHNAPARRLYESAGFVVEGVLRGEFLLDGAYVDDVLMARHLAD